MEKLDCLNQVAQFHEVFNAPVLKTPCIPNKARTDLRMALIEEEFAELKTAIQENDLIGVADAFCDLQYVLSGAILEFGLGEKFVALFNEVQRSNMSKACINEDEAKKTIQFYKEKGVEAHSKASGDKINVHRNSDDKVLKSVNYSPADLEKILNL